MALPTQETTTKRKPGEVLLVDKPLEWTSFDVVHRVKQCLTAEKVGHAGTLDPKASGLLIICTEGQTKNIEQFSSLEKEYTGVFQLGIRTPSFDLETRVSSRADISGVTLEGLQRQASRFLGVQEQVPPMYSATKHLGTPLYKYARRGKTLVRKSKQIEVFEFAILSFVPPTAEFRIVCSKGTYVRTLVDDLGNALGCGATLISLRRTRIGSLRVEDALTIEQVDRLERERTIAEHA